MTFRDLHDGELPFLLPNAWDVASALAFAAAGFPAVGTTSFGVAAAAGHPDGGRSTREATAALAAQLARLPVPVSADVEEATTTTRTRWPRTSRRSASPGSTSRTARPSSSSRRMCTRRRSPRSSGPRPTSSSTPASTPTGSAGRHRCGDAGTRGRVRRGGRRRRVRPRRDRAGGAARAGRRDPGAAQRPRRPGLSLTELGELGVRRVSTGSLPYRAAIDAAVAVAAAVRDGDDVPSATPYAEMQARLVDYSGT